MISSSVLLSICRCIVSFLVYAILSTSQKILLFFVLFVVFDITLTLVLVEFGTCIVILSEAIYYNSYIRIQLEHKHI